MDDHNPFSQGQTSLPPLPDFDSSSSPPYPFHNATWPVLFPTTMPDQNGSLPSTSALPMDMKNPISSPMPHMHSPAFEMAQPVADSKLHPDQLNSSTPLGHSPSMATSMSTLQLAGFQSGQPSSASLQIRTSMGNSEPSIQSSDLTLQQALNASASMFAQSLSQQGYGVSEPLDYTGSFGMPLQSSPTEEFIAPTSQPQMHPGMGLLVSTSMDPMTSMASMSHPAPAYGYHDMSHMMGSSWHVMGAMPSSAYADPTIAQSSPEQHLMEARSLSNMSDNSWTVIDPPHNRNSFDGLSDTSAVVSPHSLHVRADSESSHHSDLSPPSAHSRQSFDDLCFAISPEPESRSDHTHYQGQSREYPFASQEIEHPLPSPSAAGPSAVPVPASTVVTVSTAHSPSYSSSSSSPSAGNSPKTKRRTSPTGLNTPKTISKKKVPMSSNKDTKEKRIGRRKGPLRPEQREQAHEIRKLRACLRCKFLKKVCDKGNPCGGCQPSHARLWQVPCTRIDIKEIGYFLKEWNSDYERHLTLGFSIANIKGFDTRERLLYITHGYGFVMPIWAREVFVRDDKCFGLDWVEHKVGRPDVPRQYEVITAKLSAGAEGISKKMVSDYVDLHLDQGFDHFINEYFDGTPFLTELLRSINLHYLATKQENLRKGLRLVVAYCLTLHITMINGLTEEEAAIGKIEDPTSRYFGETCAPVMINFQVKKAMADLWRDLMKEVLEELSTLYSSVYAGGKQKSWPTIFMLAALILGVWEMMQFDSHYRVPEENVVNKFCEEMEHVPVGVIVGLFGAISTKLPGFQDWDSNKHGNVFMNNQAVCNTMTEVRGHIEKHGMSLSISVS